MNCAPFCSLPLSNTVRLLNCEAVLQPQLRCRLRNRYWQSPERRWCLRNGQQLRLLAKLLGKPVEKVCIFMYGLTLKKFGEILNPKCSNWNHYRVPFVRFDSCALYDGIFYPNGNIKRPIHPIVLRLLLSIINHFTNIPCERARRRRRRKDDLFTGCGETCFDPYNTRCDRPGSAGRGRRGGRWGLGGPGGRGGPGGLEGLEGMEEFWDENDDEFGYGADDYDSDDDSDDESGMVKKRKKNNADEDMVVRAPRGVVTKYGGFSGSERESIRNLSRDYNKTVTGRKGRNLEDGEDDDDYEPWPKKKKRPPPPKKKKYKGSDNVRYIGNMLPVLLHAPFDNANPMTWVRRHPEQARVLEGTRIGKAKVAHYTRPSMEAQIETAKKRFSVRSIYNVPDRESMPTTGMFGHDKVPDRKSQMAKAFNYKKLRNPTEEDDRPPKKKGKKTK